MSFEILSTKVYFWPHLMNSLILIVLAFLIRFLLLRSINRWKFPSRDIKKRWAFHIKNLVFIILLIGLSIVWAEEIRTFAISVVAVAAALVIAFKELIMCFLGGLYKFSARPFDIGDRIEIQQYRGDVIDHNLFSTIIFEAGPYGKGHQYTGRRITVPNSVFILHALYNESFSHHYTLHLFTIPFAMNKNWWRAHEILLEVANQNCSKYIEQAKRQLNRLSEKEGFDSPDASPRVNVHIIDKEELEFLVRVPVPVDQRGRIEQAIKQDFLKTFFCKTKTENIS